MNPWLIYPTWQAFSSFFREVTIANEEKSDFLKYHHLTSSLYYAISFVEALLNEKYRLRLISLGKNEKDIIFILRRGASASNRNERRNFEQKFSDWPTLICNKEIKVSDDLKRTLVEFNEIRGNLTHPKSRGHDVYTRLENINLQQLFETLVEYAIMIFAGLEEEYPYWLFGWNYLNPSKVAIDPSRINNQEFVHSLAHFGFDIRSFDAGANNAWRAASMTNFEGYRKVTQFLSQCRECEPLDPQFPFRPRLVKKWWDSTIFEKNKDYTKACPLPTFAGTRKISVMMITPFEVVSKQSNPADISSSDT